MRPYLSAPVLLLLSFTLWLALVPARSAQAEAPVIANTPTQRAQAPVPRLEIVPQAGLLQPIVMQGGNVAVDLFTPRFVFGVSHGFALNLRGGAVVGDASEQGLAFRIPFTTGVGVGYRFTHWLDLRAEFKWHRFDVGYDTSRGINGGDVARYDTFTVGAGLYGHWRPWRNRDSWVRGFNLSGSVRFWPNVATTLDGDALRYDNSYTGQRERHDAANIGIANSPWIVNLSVGYAFAL